MLLPALEGKMPHDTRLFLLLLLLIEVGLPVGVSYVLLRLPKIPAFIPCSGPSSLEFRSTYKVSVTPVSIDSLPKHHEGHQNEKSPAPVFAPGCEDNCSDPMTSSPIGSPCDCVFPMRVKLLLDVAPYTVFPLANEIEVEIATGIYLKQSQVRIMGVNTDNQNQDKTVLDVDLVPLAERFDNTTAMLTYERFFQKNVPLNTTVFGNYEVISIRYQGFAFPSSGTDMGGAPKSSVPRSFPETADMEKKNRRVNIRTIIGIALSGFVIMLVCIGVLTIFINMRSIRKPPNGDGSTLTSSINNRTSLVFTVPSNTTSSSSTSFVSNIAPSISTVKTFALGDLAEATSRFSSKRILGEGGFGRVYHGIFEDKTEVAIKLLTRDNQSREQEFVAEVEILSRLHHRNLVKLLGICIEGRTRCLVYELVHNGSVESHLHGIDKKRGLLTWDVRIKIALGAARGLAYLHEDSNPRVIHRDFKASNVLLENDFTPRVSDFGLAKEATEGSQHISTRVMGTFGYVAPEYAMTGHLLVKSDVYSYGVVLLELLTGRKPVDMSEPLGLQSLVTWARSRMAGAGATLDRLVDPTLAGGYNPDHAAKVAAIASVCIHPEVTHRPFMGEVVQALKLICNDLGETGTGTGTCTGTCTGGSQKEEGSSSVADSEFRGDFGIDCCSWSGGGGGSSAYITMEYSSEGGERRQMKTGRSGSRSGPLRMVRSLPAFYRAKGSMSEHGQPFWRQASGDLLYS